MANKKNFFSTYRIPIAVILILVLTKVVVGFIPTKNKSLAIINILEENCDCKSIEQSIYVTGIQFSKDGVTKEKGEFQLIDCNFKSLENEVNRINEILKKEVKNFNDVDQLELEFINNGISKNIIIKNGIIQRSN